MSDTLPYDILIDPAGSTPIGLMFDREPGKGAFFRLDPSPGIETTDNPVYNNVSRGMGKSEEYEPGWYGWAENAYTRGGTFVLPGPKVTEVELGDLVSDHFPIRASVWFGTTLLFFGGRRVIGFTNGTGSPTLIKDFGNNVGCGNNCAAVFTDGTTTWLCVGTVNATTDATDHMWTTTDLVTWTEHDGSGATDEIFARAFVTVQWDTNGTEATRLVRMPDRTSFATCSADPTVAANWTDATGNTVQIGSGIHAVNSIVATARWVAFATLGGLVMVDAKGNSFNVTRYWEESYSLVNGAAALVHDGVIFASWAHNLDMIGLDPSRKDRPIPCQPGDGGANGSPIAGYVPAMCTEHGWLVAFVYNPNTEKSYMCYGRRKENISNDEENPLTWHGAEAVFDAATTHARTIQPTNGDPSYLSVWTVIDAVVHNYKVSIPDYGSPYQDLLNGGSHQFAPEFAIYYPDGWHAPTSRRVLYRTDIHADRLGGTGQISVYANRNHEELAGEKVWVEEGTSYTNPRETFVSPNATSSGSYNIDFKITGQGEATDPPVFRALAPYADVNREQSKVYTVQCWVAANQSLRNGSQSSQDPEVVIEQLWNLISEQATPVDAIGPKNQELTLQFLPNVFHVEARENRDGKYGNRVTMAFRVLYGAFYWDSGITYDGAPIYS